VSQLVVAGIAFLFVYLSPLRTIQEMPEPEQQLSEALSA
jgi:hypothetical protein